MIRPYGRQVTHMEESEMRKGRCPRCGGEDIRVASSELMTFGQPFRAFGAFMLQEPAVASLTLFLCLTCSYVEYYMLDEKALRVATQKWPRVQAQK